MGTDSTSAPKPLDDSDPSCFGMLDAEKSSNAQAATATQGGSFSALQTVDSPVLEGLGIQDHEPLGSSVPELHTKSTTLPHDTSAQDTQDGSAAGGNRFSASDAEIPAAARQQSSSAAAQGSAPPTLPPGLKKEEVRFVETLILRQRDSMQRILADLEKNGRKTLHYAWWLFPTELPGASEPDRNGSKSRVCIETAAYVIQNPDTAVEWRKALEMTCDLIEKSKTNPTRVLPAIDHGRVHFFIEFWGTKYSGSPEWMLNVVKRLQCYKWR